MREAQTFVRFRATEGQHQLPPNLVSWRGMSVVREPSYTLAIYNILSWHFPVMDGKQKKRNSCLRRMLPDKEEELILYLSTQAHPLQSRFVA